MLSLFRRTVHPEAPSRPRLPADLLAKVRRIEVGTNRLVDEGLAGQYHSVFKGRGIEFTEARPYQPGDDVRSIDWNVSARMGTTYVKRFVEERDLTVFLAIDVSGSLEFGSGMIRKRELAAEVAALLAFAALRNHDRVGAALMTDRVELFLEPRRHRNHVLRLVREILSSPACGATDLEAALDGALRVLKPRSVLFLLSDFLATRYERALKMAAARHDLIVVELLDPRELALPRVGPVVLRDAEAGTAALVSGARAAASHQAQRRQERAQLRSLVRRLGADHLVLRTDGPYLGALISLFERRKRRQRRKR